MEDCGEGKGNNGGDKGNGRKWGREITVAIRVMRDCGEGK